MSRTTMTGYMALATAAMLAGAGIPSDLATDTALAIKSRVDEGQSRRRWSKVDALQTRAGKAVKTRSKRAA